MHEIYKILDHDTLRNLVISIILFLGLLILRRITLRAVLKPDMPAEVRRRLIVKTRTATFLLAVLVFVFIWAHEIRSLAFSAFAIAAAIVIATKELILCISGAFYRTSVRNFGVGDRIEIGAFRGDVIDQTLLATTLMEIGPGQTGHQYTGRTVVLPNALFLNTPAINETFTDDFVLHVFTVPVKTGQDWQAVETRLLEAARAECEPYIEQARKHFARIQDRYSLQSTQIEPRVYLRLMDPDRMDLLVRIPVPARQKGRIEQAILRRFLQNPPSAAAQQNSPL